MRMPRVEAQAAGEFSSSCANVLHQRGDLHELDARANAVEPCHAFQKRIVKEGSGRVFRVPDVKVRGFTLSGIDREGLGAQTRHSLKSSRALSRRSSAPL